VSDPGWALVARGRIPTATRRARSSRSAVRSLAEKAIALGDVATLFIPHHHDDHIGELADSAIPSWRDGRGRLPVFGPPGSARIYSPLLEQVYDRDPEFPDGEGTAEFSFIMSGLAGSRMSFRVERVPERAPPAAGATPRAIRWARTCPRRVVATERNRAWHSA
jgi:glyoxylase-like metal-dependent hydrolase (beta-lactamase superfamily II)